MKTGQLIRELRTKKGLTQEDLAAKTDISVRTIQRIESGDVDPRAFTLQSIAAALEVDFEIFANSDPELNGQNQQESSRWLPLLHLSGLLILIIPPIIIWIWKRDNVTDIRKHAFDVINFQLSMSLYLLPCLLFSIHPITLVLVVYSQVMIIINTVKVTNNRDYKYPMSIRFLKHEPLVLENR
jgi:transcriptional regulator with XRE-family HTH domain